VIRRRLGNAAAFASAGSYPTVAIQDLGMGTECIGITHPNGVARMPKISTSEL